MSKPFLALTAGDPNGIGPEIAIKAVRYRAIRALCRPVIFGSAETLTETAEKMKLSLKGLAIEDTGRCLGRLRFGRVDPRAGDEAIRALDQALDAVRRGRMRALVTAPICKEAVVLSGRKGFVGHTDYIADRMKVRDYCLALYAEQRAIAFVTLHISLRGALRAITSARVARTGRLLHGFLSGLIRGRVPRLAVAGLNPHAGEGGLFGLEEQRAVLPAVRALAREGIRLTGPVPPDVVFPSLFAGRFDGVVSLLHDHGHVAFKTAHFRFAARGGGRTSGVNVTLGLPVIRTSTDHGTAFDIAGRGVAHPGSLVDALKLAAKL